MGRDKSALPFGQKTLLQHIVQVARKTGWPVRIIRRDSVPRCGPLGGIHTAFQRSSAASILFLACDMPFITLALLARIFRSAQSSPKALFTFHRGRVGFPLVLHRPDLAVVKSLIAQDRGSLQSLASVLHANRFTVPPSRSRQLTNVNTWEDWTEACSRGAMPSAQRSAAATG